MTVPSRRGPAEAHSSKPSDNFTYCLFVEPCPVCRGEPCGSNEMCTCGRCINCNLPSTTPLCPRCLANQQCTCCHRHLPSHSFTNNSNQCNACLKKQQTQRHASVANIVNEVTIPTVHGINSFDAFVSVNSGVIAAVMDDYQRQYRYVREKLVDK